MNDSQVIGADLHETNTDKAPLTIPVPTQTETAIMDAQDEAGALDYDTPQWIANWTALLALARSLHAQGDKFNQKFLADSLGMSASHVAYAVKAAKRTRTDEHAELFQLMGKKPKNFGPRDADEDEEDPGMETDQVGDIDSEEITDQDALAHILNTLTGFDPDDRTRILTTAAVFLGVDFVSLTDQRLVTCRPRPKQEASATVSQD